MNRIPFSLLLLCTLLLTSRAQAAIFIDFGAKNALGTEQGPAGITDVWQNVSSATVTLTGGENLEVRRGDNSSDTFITWLGGAAFKTTDDKDAVGSVMRAEQNIYDDYARGGDNGRSVGWRLNGLAAGTYDVYMVTNDFSTEAGSLVALGVLDGGFTGDMDVGDLTQTTTALVEDVNNDLTSWTASAGAGDEYNYIKATLTLDSTTDYITGFMQSARGAGSNGNMGFHSIQIVAAIPEPSSLVLVGGSFLGLIGLLARRSR